MPNFDSSDRMAAGLAHRQDLDDARFKELLAELDQHQRSFLALESAFRSKDYRWPRDAIRNWSRVWEYPFVYSNLQQQMLHKGQVAKLRGLDFGSGVTFFPFAVARLGADVICVDNDPVCIGDLNKASGIVEKGPGSVSAVLISDDSLPFPDEYFDFAYCISVLEHISEPQRVLSELARVIKPGGQFLLTIDIDLKGNLAIGPRDYYPLIDELRRLFKEIIDPRCGHPLSMLTSQNSPFPFCDSSALFRLTCHVKDLARSLLGRDRHGFPPFLLAVEGRAFARR